MALKYKLIGLMSDGKVYSGQILGSKLNITRSAICKAMRQIEAMGVTVNKLKGRGYQLVSPIELLDKDEIRGHWPVTLQETVRLQVHEETDSTNQVLLNNPKLPIGTTILSEYQSKGRGRRSRPWYGAFGGGIYCSMIWNFDQDPGELSGLSLAIGVAIIFALERCAVHQLKLKWPNDILWNNRKLGGVLIELIAESHSQTQAVIGIGINLNPNPSKHEESHGQWVSLSQIPGIRVERNKLTAYIIEELVEALKLFQKNGFTAFIKHWQALDAYYRCPVRVLTPSNEVVGIAYGVSDKGELCIVDGANNELRFLHGEVSLRGMIT